MKSVEQYTHEEVASLWENDESLIKLANQCRTSLHSSPTQSDFRVLAILVIKNSDNSLSLIVGSNAEQAYIGGAICAERSALVKLRFLDKPTIAKVVIVTDSEFPLSPGVLCREYLMSTASLDTPLVLGNGAGDKVVKCKLGQLWPFPYVYRSQTRHHVIEYAQNLQSTYKNSSTIEDIEILRLFQKATDVNKYDNNDKLHPIRFSAGVLFEDGSVNVSWMLKGIEYGNTLDPVSQLMYAIEQQKLCGTCNEGDNLQTNVYNKPKVIVMVDQFGIAHAPFAQARCLLFEHGYTYVNILVHNEQGEFVLTKVQDLIPQPSEDIKILSHDDFH